MPKPISRRRFVANSLAATFAVAMVGGRSLRPAEAIKLSPDGQRFSEAWLVEYAEQLAKKDFVSVREKLPPALESLNYDKHREIRFRADQSLWREQGLSFQTQFFHLGSVFKKPVHIYDVVDGQAYEVLYEAGLFDYGSNKFDPALPGKLGFAGFRAHYPINRPDYFDEVAVFLGASYFRSLARGQQYGLSARGLAINTAQQEGEEFPEFRDFWLERPPQGATKLTVHALLDSPSATGAYKFTISPGKTTEMEVRATLFIRKKIARLGIAPLTSMYFVGGTTAVRPDDFRPQVHDSQGLSVWTGKGEWIWRPLGNPRRLRLSLFADESPRGFGLLQRDRDFRNYQDLEAHYERRPSLWVEPIDALGKGWIQLVEIPTDAEIHDNIVAFWTPEQAVEAGQRMRLAYRLHWCDESPHRPNIAETTSSRTGRASFGGKKIDGAARKFVVDFKGGKLGSLPADAKPQPMISVTNAKVIYSVAQKLTGTDGWRLTFDLAADGTKPVELRCALVLNDETLSETWSYQWSP